MLQKLGIAIKVERTDDQRMIAPEMERRFAFPHTLVVNDAAPLVDPTWPWIYTQTVQLVLFFPRLDECQAAMCSSFSASSRNFCGPGDPTITASIS